MNKHSDGFRAGEPEVTKSVEAQLRANPLNTYRLVKHLQTLVSFFCWLTLCPYSSYLITQKCSLGHGLEFVGSLKKFVFVSFTSVSRIGARSQAGHNRIDYSPELNFKSSALL